MLRCRLEFCDRDEKVKGFCRVHYQYYKAGKELKPLGEQKSYIKRPKKPCKISFCVKESTIKGYCRPHYVLARTFKFSEKDIEALPKACEVCGSEVRLHVDHNHATDAYRGILCSGCNTALGLAKDNAETLRGLALYVEERS